MFKPGHILKHRKHGSLIRILKRNPAYGHEVLTSYFYASMSDAITFENYQPASFLQWVKATWPHLIDQYQRRKTKQQPTFMWLLNTIRQAYLPKWRLP